MFVSVFDMDKYICIVNECVYMCVGVWWTDINGYIVALLVLVTLILAAIVSPRKLDHLFYVAR